MVGLYLADVAAKVGIAHPESGAVLTLLLFMAEPGFVNLEVGETEGIARLAHRLVGLFEEVVGIEGEDMDVGFQLGGHMEKGRAAWAAEARADGKAVAEGIHSPTYDVARIGGLEALVEGVEFRR